MSIDNLPQSARGTLRIRNLTHYNTDDIVALVNRIEESRPASQFQWAGNVERATVPGMQKVLELREFTGAPRHENVYVDGVSVQGRVLLLAPVRWRAPLTLRLVPPDKLYSSPLQTLSEEAMCDTRTLPAPMLLELAETIARLWRTSRTGLGNTVPVILLDGLSIRIDKTRAKGNKKHAALARKRTMIHESHQSVTYRSKQAERAVEIMLQDAIRMQSLAGGMGMGAEPLNELVSQMKTAYGIVKGARERTEQLAREAQEMVDAC